MGQQGGGGGHFEWLRQHPQFNQIKAMVQRNPQLLGPLLQQLGQLNPQILQTIGQHQAEFMALLNEPIQGGAAAAGGPGGAPPGSNYIQVTQEEKEAIDRVRLPPLSFLLYRGRLANVCSVITAASPRL
jgi:UV excision repair protein RAD23